MHEEPLTPAQRGFLEKLRGREAAEGFYLAGGSALALVLRHRRSLDHDLFRAKPFQPTRLREDLAAILGPLKPLEFAKGTLTVETGGLKASFFAESMHAHRKDTKFPGVQYQRHHFLKALVYFEDAMEEPLQYLRAAPRWEEVRGFFRREAAGCRPEGGGCNLPPHRVGPTQRKKSGLRPSSGACPA